MDMNTSPHLAFNPKLSLRVVERIVSFILQVDEFVALLRPASSKPLSTDFRPLFMGEAQADSEEGYRLMMAFQDQCGAEGYRLTKSDAEKLLTYMMTTAMHCAAEALHAADDDEAYGLLSDGRHLHGYAAGVVLGGNDAVLRQEFAQKGGLATKAAFEPRKVKIHEWCNKNYNTYRSVSAAAQVASIDVPMATKTAVKYINEWKNGKN